ncbi:MAG: efflux RND transporter periplasmic adaptor subunit [Gammaproteobacteria bacterium]
MRNWMRIAALLSGVCLSPAGVAVELNGELAWADKVVLSVPFSGRMLEVSVRPGERVAAGQILLRFDTRIAAARAAQARAAVEGLGLQRAEARREWDRAKELFERTVLSVRELQLAEIGYHAAEADYQAARAARIAAEVELEDLNLVAPFAARVLAVHVAPGQAVVNAQQAMPLVTLAADGHMRVRAALDAAQAGALDATAPVAVRVGERRFTGRIVEVGAEPLGPERPAGYALVVEFEAPAEAALRAGQPASLSLP